MLEGWPKIWSSSCVVSQLDAQPESALDNQNNTRVNASVSAPGAAGSPAAVAGILPSSLQRRHSLCSDTPDTSGGLHVSEQLRLVRRQRTLFSCCQRFSIVIAIISYGGGPSHECCICFMETDCWGHPLSHQLEGASS